MKKRRRVLPTPADYRATWLLVMGLLMSSLIMLATDPISATINTRHLVDEHVCLVYYEAGGAVGTRYVRC